ncbi:MAG: WG repeat-containing protein [Oscillospiraceae bacterium]|jgi:hypothetical protein|nr:WG repeat-containing protein [Oscillospiraceae bacterium]
MNKASRILLGLGFLALLLISWAVAANSKSPAQKQTELIAEATALISDAIYVRAMPLLEEAVGYDAAYTLEAETLLKGVYLKLMGQSGIKNKYTDLLNKQMEREDTTAAIFTEAANFYISTNKLKTALEVLKRGARKLNDQGLIDFYEAERYAFKVNRITYEDVTAIVNGKIQVSKEGLWGLANSDGGLIIPCECEKITNCDNSRVIVLKGGEIYAVDLRNNRIDLLHEKATDFGNYGNDRVAVLTDKGWQRATGGLILDSKVFEGVGMYSGGYAAAKQGGKWGVVDIGVNWLVPAEYDEIIRDELGRCYAQGAVFAVKDGKTILIIDGVDTGKTYDDARPFTDDGLAAVKLNGKWGFIDKAGEIRIEPQFDDALSFSEHLAAVKQGDLWGYAALTGKIAIEPQFLQAKSFSNGNAPILGERGWQFITLVEYKQEAGL